MANTVTSPKNREVSSRTAPIEDIQPSQDLVAYLKEYARAKPDVAALWCFGIGFIIGWKLKPW